MTYLDRRSFARDRKEIDQITMWAISIANHRD